MSAADPNVKELTAQDRQKLDELLGEFHRTWELGRLDRVLAELPLDLRYRLAAVTGIVAIDLEMQWQRGNHIRVETYLDKYPELGTAENVSIELLLAEFLAQERHDTAPDQGEFLARFPQQADELRRLISLARSPRLSGVRSRSSSSSSSIGGQPAEDGPALPEQFDRYRIQKKLGQGGMGTVYLAYDTRLERKVALKVPRFDPGSNHENLERFYREAKATATITHPNLCPLYDVGEIDGTPYLTMAYIEGWPLSKFIRPDKLLPQFGVATVVRIVAQAIEEAHKRGVIHRDLKPGNIMINKRGEPIVMDFGLARWLKADKEDVRLTRSGAILGAPVYMSPEQVYGDVDAMGPGCDVYSLGVILYELMTGRLPFDGPTTAVLAKTLIQPPTPPSAHRPDIDPRLEAICLKAMAKKIPDRYATMHDFAAALTEYIRAERQAQTLTSLSMTKLPTNGSQMSLSSSSDPSLSGVGKSQATTATVIVPHGVTTTNGDQTDVLDAADLLEAAHSDIQIKKPRRSQTVLWVALACVGLLAALPIAGFAGWMMWSSPAVSTIAPPLPLASTGTIQIALDPVPNDLQVLLDGKAVDSAKLLAGVKWKPGQYGLQINSSKFEPWFQEVLVKDGETELITVTLKPKAPAIVDVTPKELQPGLPFAGHTGPVKSVAWVDDRSLLSGSEDFSIKLWDAVTRTPKQGFSDQGHSLPVTSIAVSKDGTRALSGSGDGLVILWELPTGKVLQRLKGHADWVRAVAISGDGKWGLSAGDDKIVRVWNLEKGVEHKQLPGHQGTVWAVAFSPDGKRAASAGDGNTVRIWNLDSDAKVLELKGHTASVRGLAFLPDGRLLSASDDSTLRLWNTTTGTTQKVFSGHTGKVRGVAVTSDGKRAASVGFGNADNTVRVWDVATGLVIHGVAASPEGFNAVAFSPNDRWLATGGEDRSIYVWDPLKALTAPLPTPVAEGPSREIRRFSAPLHKIDRVAVSKDGRFALSGGYDGTVRYWDLNQGREIRKIPAHKGTIPFVAFSPDERLALSCGEDKLACLWKLETGELVKKFEGHGDKVWCVAFTADGKRIFTSAGDKDPTARLWDVETGNLLQKYEGHTKTINQFALSPDGKLLVTASWDGSLRVWNVETAKELHKFGGMMGRFSAVAFFPDGRRVVAGYGMKVRVFDVIDFKEIRLNDDPPSHTGGVWSVAVSPGGHRMLSSGQDKIICLWDVETGQVVQKYTGHTDTVPGVAFLPDGARFLSGSKDTTLRLWELPRNLCDPPPLPASQETSQETKLLKGHATNFIIEQVLFLPDGKRAMSCSHDKTVRLWDLVEGKQIGQFKEHTGPVHSFALLPDGKRVLSASYDSTLRLWDLKSGKEISVFKGHALRAQSVAVTSDGKRAVSVGDDKFVHLWNVDTATELKKLEGHEKPIFTLALTPDDREAITGSFDKTIRRWNLETGAEVARWKTASDIHTLALSPDGRRVLSGGKDKLVQLWNRESGELLASFRGHTGTITCVRFSPDGRWAISSSDDQTARLWNIETGQEMGRYTGHTRSVKGVAFSPDGRSALSCSHDATIRLWTLPPYTAAIPVDSLKSIATPDKIDRVAISPDGRSALSAGYDKLVRQWDLERGEETKTYDWHKEKDGVRYVSFSPDGRQAASCGNDKTAVVWEVDSGNLVRRVEGHQGTVWGALFSPDGKRLLTCSEDGTAMVWDIETGAAVHTFRGHTKRVNSAAWTPDGTRILTAGIDKTARLWDVKTGKELKRFEGHTEGVSTIAISPNGRHVTTGSYDKTVRLWDLETAECLHIFDGHTAQVWIVAFSPDGRRILSGGGDKTMKLWDVERRSLLHSYNKHLAGVTGVAFHPDGLRALSGSMDKTMRLWGLPVY